MDENDKKPVQAACATLFLPLRHSHPEVLPLGPKIVLNGRCVAGHTSLGILKFEDVSTALQSQLKLSKFGKLFGGLSGHHEPWPMGYDCHHMNGGCDYFQTLRLGLCYCSMAGTKRVRVTAIS
jgi:hypothetical protein